MVPNARQPPAEPAVGVFSQTIGTKLYPGRIDEAANGLTSNDETASTALSARSSGLDDGNSGPECRVYTQMSGVEQVCVRGGLQGGGGAPGIALVAAQEVGQAAFFGLDDGAGVVGDEPAQHRIGVLLVTQVAGAVQTPGAAAVIVVKA